MQENRGVSGEITWRRRDFLRVGAAATGGLLVSIALPGCRAPRRRVPFAPNAFVRVDPDDTVTVTIHKPEMGQGVRTSLAMIVADELDADWSRLRVEQGDLDAAFGKGTQFAGGSSSVRLSWEPLRRAGAVARAALVEAAAAEWRVPSSECRPERGVVLHPRTGRRLRYGELAARAAARPAAVHAPLKDPRTFTLVGQRTGSVDCSRIVSGAIPFGIDVRVPGMLVAVVERSPVFGGRMRAVDDAAARRVRGVRDVVIVDADALPDLGGDGFGEASPRPANGVAVVAEHTWPALVGRRALRVTWDPGPGEAESTEAIRARCATVAARPPEKVWRDDGHVDRALATSARRVEAVYELPFLAHAPMEPMSCVAHVRERDCELWVPTQNPDGARAVAARITGLAPDAVTVHVTRMGGAFGRRFYADFVAEAVVVSRAVRAPVQVLWTREDDMRHGLYRPMAYHVMRAGLDGHGRVTAWSDHLVNASRGEFLRYEQPNGRTEYEAGVGEFDPDDFPAALVPNLRLAASAIHTRIPRGQWRAVEPSSNVFVVQSFVDELAHAAGRDPLAFRLELLGPPRALPFYSRTYDTGRLRAVLELAAARAGWGTPLTRGHGRGIAACYANGSYNAQVAEVEVDAAGRVRVHRVVAAVDCGLVVNPLGVEAQVQGAIAYGLSAALHGEITVSGGRVDQGNFDDYRVLRIEEMPRVEVHLVPGGDVPLGIGEGPLPPIAPAVTNAIFAATGRRVRRLPVAPAPGA